MKFNPNIHHRQSTRLRDYDYSQPGFYFVTICTHERRLLFGDVIDGEMVLNAAGKLVELAWCDLPNHYLHVELEEFVVMPNHFHGIVRFNDVMEDGGQGANLGQGISEETNRERAIPESPLHVRRKMRLSKLIGRFKMVSAKHINQLRGICGTPVWQRNYHEHIVRSEAGYLKIAEYVRGNPRQWTEDTYHI